MDQKEDANWALQLFTLGFPVFLNGFEKQLQQIKGKSQTRTIKIIQKRAKKNKQMFLTEQICLGGSVGRESDFICLFHIS
jgi:hypothetical protein